MRKKEKSSLLLFNVEKQKMDFCSGCGLTEFSKKVPLGQQRANMLSHFYWVCLYPVWEDTYPLPCKKLILVNVPESKLSEASLGTEY